MSPTRADTWKLPQHIIRLSPDDSRAFRGHLVDEDMQKAKQVVGSTLLRAWTRGAITTAQIHTWATEFGPWLPAQGTSAGTLAAEQPQEVFRLSPADDKAFRKHLIDEGITKQILGSTLLRAWTRGAITTAQIHTWAAEFGPWLPESTATR